MKLAIYQVNSDRDVNNVMFMSYDRTQKYQRAKEIQSSIYDKVYECTLPASSLEDVYFIFNQRHPEDYKGRSLSVSDIVEVSDCPSVVPGFYFCDSFGFTKVSFEPEKAMEFQPVQIPSEPQIPVADASRYDAKTGLIRLDARLGISLQVTAEEMHKLQKGDGEALKLMMDLVRSERCVIGGDTYFPEPWNEGVLPEEINFDLPVMPMVSKEQQKQPLDQQIRNNNPEPSVGNPTEGKSKGNEFSL